MKNICLLFLLPLFFVFSGKLFGQTAILIPDDNGSSGATNCWIQIEDGTATGGVTGFVISPANSKRVEFTITHKAGSSNDFTIKQGVDNSGDVIYTHTGSNASEVTNGPFITSHDPANGATGSIYIEINGNANTTGSDEYFIEVKGVLDPIFTINQISCHGYSDGEISIVANGAGGTDVFNWTANNNLSFSSTLDSETTLKSDIYNISLQDKNSCKFDTSINISDPAPLFNVSISQKPTCFEVSDGQAMIEATGGTAPYTYSWDGGTNPSNDTISDLVKDQTYTCTVSDNSGSGCSVLKSITISENPEIVATINEDAVNCFGETDQGQLTITSAVANAYAWDGGTNPATATISALSPATPYNCVITQNLSVGSCTETFNYTTSEANPSIVPSYLVDKMACFGVSDGQTTVSATGGNNADFTFDWPSGSDIATRSDLALGSYTVTVIDNDYTYCTNTVTVNQTQNDEITATISEDRINCNGESDQGKLTITPSVADSYLWNGGINTNTASVSGLNANTTYNCIITDNITGGSCTESFNYTTSEANPVIVTSYLVDKMSCFEDADGQITISATGGNNDDFTFDWPSGSDIATRSDLSVGSYTITIIDNDFTYCTQTIEVTQTENPEITATISEDRINCNGESNQGQLTISPSIADLYLWNDGSSTTVATVTGLDANTLYNCIITDNISGGSCTETFNYTTSEANPDIVPSYLVDKMACFGDSDGQTTVSATGGNNADFTFDWPSGSDIATRSDLALGSYTVTVIDNDYTYCTNTVTVNQTENSQININPIPLTYNDGWNISCNGLNDGEVDLSVTNGTAPYTYLWNNGLTNQTAQNLSEGSYSYTVTDDIGCVNNGSITLNESPAITITETISNATQKSGNDGSISTIVSNAVGTIDYTWLGGNSVVDSTRSSIENLNAGWFNLTVTDDNGCTKSEIYEVTEPSDLLGGTIRIGTSGSITDSAICEYLLSQTLNIQEINAPSGGDYGGAPSYSYKWIISTDNSNWEYVSGQTGSNASFDMEINQDTWFARVVYSNSDTALSNSVFFEFIPDPELQILNLDDAYCQNDSTSIQLVGVPTNSFGVFSGYAVTNSSAGKALFDPFSFNDTVTTQNSIAIRYTYTDSHGCQTYVDSTTKINPKPQRPRFTLPAKLSQEENNYQIVVSDAGGTFTGEAITSSGIINLQSLTAGTTYDYKYTIYNTYGCFNDSTNNTQILEGTGEFILAADSSSLERYFCYYDDTVFLLPNPSQSVDIGTGKFLTIDTLDNGIGFFLPESIGANSLIIDYEYYSSSSRQVITKEIIVDSLVGKAQIIGLDDEYCLANENISIRAGNLSSNETGQFYGNGLVAANLNNATFDIDYAREFGNIVDIKYILTNTNSQCKDSVDQTVTIHDLPTVGFHIKDTFFVKGDTVEFEDQVPPTNAVFSGNGVTYDQRFSPSQAGLGLHNITMYYEQDYATVTCSNDSTKSVLVEDYKGQINGFTADRINCYDGEQDTLYYTKLPSYNHSLGRFYIDDIMYNASDTMTFTPSALTAGEHTIKHAYLGSDGITWFWKEENLYIDDIGILDIEVPNDEFCIYSEADTLIGKRRGQYDPGGYFTYADGSSGVNGLYNLIDAHDGKAKFRADEAMVGTHKIMYHYPSQYEYNSNLSTCIVYDSINLIVHPRPTIDFVIKDYYNVDGENEAISATPSMGSFTPSEFFVNDSIFSPSAAGVGDKEIFYNYVDPSTLCEKTISKPTLVDTVKGSISGLPLANIYCTNGIVDTLTYIPADTNIYIPICFLLDIDTLSVASNQVIINPINVTPGMHILYYHYIGQDGNTKFILSTTLYFDEIGVLEISILNDEIEFCDYDAGDILSGKRNGSPSNWGYFLGNGIDNSNPLTAGSASFYPELADIGLNEITYVYTSEYPQSICRDSVSVDLMVHPKPSLTFNINSLYYVDGPNDTLHAEPIGGRYFPEEFIINDSVFSPKLPGSGGGANNISLFYEYTDETTTCLDTIEATTVVEDAFGIIVGNTEEVYCYDASPIVLSVTAITNSDGTDGVFYGNGITNIGGKKANFNIQDAYDLTTNLNVGKVEVPISYEYIGYDGLTKFYIYDTIVIRNNGVVSFLNVSDNNSYCANGDTVLLSATPYGGTFTHYAMIDSAFIPPLVIEDTTQLVYSYTDSEDGCSIAGSEDIYIIQPPVLEFDLQTIYNVEGINDTLNGTPDYGAYSPLAYFIDDSIFTPSNIGSGNYWVYYELTDSITGCTNVDSMNTIIDTVKGEFTGINKDVYCYNDSEFEISVAGITNSNGDVGLFYGNGITNLGENKALINVNTAYNLETSAIEGKVKVGIAYEYTGTDGFTKFLLRDSIIIRNNGVVSFLNLSDNKSYCSNGDTILLSASPYGGTFTHYAMIDSAFIPPLVIEDTTQLVYSYTDSEDGCSIEGVEDIYIIQPPLLDFDLKALYNVEGDNDTLNGTPNYGSFSPIDYFIEDSIFIPSNIGSGNYMVYYELTDSVTSCTNVDSMITLIDTVKGEFTGINKDVFCYNDSEFEISVAGVTNSNGDVGLFYGNGITNLGENKARINVNTAYDLETSAIEGKVKVGIAYEYTGTDGFTKFLLRDSIIIRNNGVVNFLNLTDNNSYCSNGDSVLLSASPFGGFFNHYAMVDSSFFPTLVIEDTTQIQYTHTDTVDGCTIVGTEEIYIIQPPELSFDLKTLYNVDGKNDTLTGSPNYGSFSPDSLFIRDSIFSPSLIGTGDYVVYYELQDNVTTCWQIDSLQTRIDTAKGDFIGLPIANVYCKDGISDTIFYEPENGENYLPIAFLIENDTLSIGNDSAVIIPSSYEGGYYTLFHHYYGDDLETKFILSTEIYIDDIGMVEIASLSNDDYEYCIYEIGDTLIGKRAGDIANSGLFTGFGISDLNEEGLPGYAFFKPTTDKIGNNNYTFTYTSLHEGSSCNKQSTVSITVHDRPNITFNAPSLLNETDTSEILVANPSGGIFFYENDTIENANFNASVYGAGTGSKIVELNYRYQHPSTGCWDTIYSETNIQRAQGTLAVSDDSVCYEAIQFINATVFNGNDIPGIFSGDGITNIGTNRARFNAKQAFDLSNTETTVLTVPYVYEYTGQDDFTKFYLYDTMYVQYSGKVVFGNSLTDFKFCNNGEPISFDAMPAGGQFLFGDEELEDNVFIPKNFNSSDTIRYSYIDPEFNCEVSKDSLIEILYPLPISFNVGDTLEVCENGNTEVIVGYPRGGDFSYAFEDPFQDIGGNIDSVLYNPTVDILGNHYIYYYYEDTDSTTCYNTDSTLITVHELLSLTIEGLDDAYCHMVDPVTLTGEYNNSLISSGVFSGNNGIVDSISNLGETTFNPGLINPGIYSVKLSYVDDHGCNSTTSEPVEIYTLPAPYVDNYNEVYCANDDQTYSFSGQNSGSVSIQSQEFVINGFGLEQSFYNFTPDDYDDLVYVQMSYEITDDNGCVNTFNDSIQIFPEPKIKIHVSDICIEESIEFSVVANSDSTEISDISMYSWSFYDPLNDEPNDAQHDANATTADTPSVSYASSGERTISVEIHENKYNCASIADTQYYFESDPDANFDWFNECINDKPVHFKPLSPVNSEFYNYTWDYGDGSIGNLEDSLYRYEYDGEYEVSFNISSKNSTCANTVSKTISIRPTVSFSEIEKYEESFEDANGGWVSEPLTIDSLNSWQRGIPNSDIINYAFNGSKAYITNPEGLYQANELSAVTSPCYDLTALDRPMISMAIWSDLEEGRDGVALQYGKANGDNVITWHNVGKLNLGSGLNWHTERAISGLLDLDNGVEDGEGWDMENAADWLVAKHDLDFITNESSVRFRIVFGSDNIQQNEGFAFDNIVIGNRERKVLIEHFTNTQDENSNDANNKVNYVGNSIPLDAIDIQYHTSYPANDPFYNQYPNGSGTRESFYNIIETPYALMDGVNPFDFKSNAPSIVKVKNQSLKDPLCNIEIATERIGNNIDIDIDITAIDVDLLNSRELYLFTAVVEREVVADINNQSITFQNVLRSMLPNPGGTYIQHDWNSKSTASYDLNYAIDDHVDPEQTIVITFVQDENTKEILQTATDDTTSVVTDLKELFSNNESLDYKMYPNPASGSVTIIFNSAIANNDVVTIVNQQGKIINRWIPTTGNIVELVDLNNFSEGIYFVNWQRDHVRVVKKLVVFK